MRRLLLLLPAALGALALPAAAAEPAEVPSLGVRVATCETGATLADRAAEFTGAMPGAPGASVLSMRFGLEQRRGGTWRSVAVPAWKAWERSVPGAEGFVYDRRIERLAAGATYRAEVQFRWTAADGRVLRRAERHSRACRQPDLRPDLTVTGVTSEPAADGRARYVAQVRNDGPGALTRSARVRLTVGGVAQPVRTVAALADGAIAAVALDGPACTPGQEVVAEVDPDDAVEEGDEADNAAALRCA